MSNDWKDETVEWDQDGRAAWCEQWAPKCPIGNPQRLAVLVGYREREPGRLQLRVVMSGHDGVCHALTEEDENTVRVRVLLCYEETSQDLEDPDYVNCPVHVYLDNPLNGRTVIAVDDDQPLPLYRPKWEAEHNRRVRRQERSGESAV